MGTFSNRRLLLLGGYSGIGQDACRYLMESGEFAVARTWGSEFADVRSVSDVDNLVSSFRPTDIVYSVGINKLDWIEQITLHDFNTVMETNVWGFLNLLGALERANLQTPPNIVAVTSDAAWRPMRTSAVYCASKAALEMAIRVASREYAPHRWRINGVAPGKVEDTPMTEYVDQRVLELREWSPEKAEAYELASTPLGRKVTKREVSQVIKQVLFGPLAQTGEIIAVNGGR